MVAERVADMTIEELNRLIERVVTRRLSHLQPPKDKRSVQEILDSIDRNRITPPLGAKSPLELLREDRDA